MESRNRLIVHLILVAGLVMIATQGLAESVVPLDLGGVVHASASSDIDYGGTPWDEGWNYAKACGGGSMFMGYWTWYWTQGAEIELTNHEWGASLACSTYGDLGAGEAGTSDPATLVIGTSDDAPAGTPLILVLDPSIEHWRWNTGHFSFCLSREDEEILALSRPEYRHVDVFAGETLTLDFSMRIGGSGPGDTWPSRVVFNMLVIPEPATLVIAALGGLALLVRRRAK